MPDAPADAAEANRIILDICANTKAKLSFSNSDRAFPDAEVVSSADGENTAQLWQRFLATWRWRVAQIQSGQIEVVLDAIPATEDSEPPEEAMTMETLNEAYNDYRALAGWER